MIFFSFGELFCIPFAKVNKSDSCMCHVCAHRQTDIDTDRPDVSAAADESVSVSAARICGERESELSVSASVSINKSAADCSGFSLEMVKR